MTHGLKDAFNTVARFWPLIFVLGFAEVLASIGIDQSLLLLDFLIILSITILAYGRITATVVGDRKSSARMILSENWLNFTIAVIIIGAPASALRVLVGGRLESLLAYVTLGTAVSALIGILTLYVLPIVFLRKTSIAALPDAVGFLFNNFGTSAWIAGVVLIAHVLSAITLLVFRSGPIPLNSFLAFVVSVLGEFVSFVAFAAALRELLRVRGLDADRRA